MNAETPSPANSPESSITPETSSAGRTACVIGSGFGGLALAIRLQSAGISTTVIEARDKPGGCAYYWEKDGFTFDAGPTIITDPDCLRELWALTDHNMADDIEIMPVMPFYRFSWPDGTNFDYLNNEEQMFSEIAKLSPSDVAGYQRFLDYSAEIYEETRIKAHKPFLTFKSMLKTVPALMKNKTWRSSYSIISNYVDNQKLREALSCHTLLTGGNPMARSGICALGQTLEKHKAVWWVKGGTNRLIAAMVTHFERLGGTVRLHDPVVHIHTLGCRVNEVETLSGWSQRFDAVASNADIMHSYRDLLSGSKRGSSYARRLSRKSYSSSMFAVHFGIEGTWPGIPHHMVLFGQHYEGLLEDVFDNGVLPQDILIYLHHPSVTDPSVAPEGMSTFYALVPVAHMGKLSVDWAQMGPILEARILEEIERRLIPDIRSRIKTKFHYTPRDFAMDLNAYMGSAFSLEPILSQSAYFRPHNRDDVIDNFYLVGAGTHPGPGIPGVMSGARATADLMLEDLFAT